MPLTIYKRGNIWHVRGKVAGRRIRESSGTTDRKIAERVAHEIEKGAWERRFDGPGATLTMAQAALAYLDADKSDRFLAKVAGHWRDTLVREITPEAIRQSARKIYPKASGATWNRQVIVPTAAIINFAAGLGWCQPVKVKRFPVSPKKKTPANREWVAAFAAQAVADDLPHIAALAWFMFGTAARVGEATSLTWADVDLDKRAALIRMGKPTPWERTAHLPPPVVAALANIPSNRQPAELVFDLAGRGSVYKTWANICDRAGIDQLTPHSCRHGFATEMLRRGIDVKTVADAGGWKDAATVLRTYAHATKDRTITDRLFDTPATQHAGAETLTTRKKKTK